MIKCLTCGDEYKSPTDNDDFRNLFISFGNQGVKQAENIGSAYLARKQGWVDDAGVIWACPKCRNARGRK